MNESQFERIVREIASLRQEVSALRDTIQKPNQRADKLLTVMEVAKMFSRSEETIRIWVRRRKLPVVKMSGRTLLFRPADIERAISAWTLKGL